MFSIVKQQKQDKEGNVRDVDVKTVYRPVYDDDNPDEPKRFIPVCDQMLIQADKEPDPEKYIKLKYFTGKVKVITNWLGKQQQVNTGGFIVEYPPCNKSIYKGRLKAVEVVKEQNKESRMTPQAFEEYCQRRFGIDLTARIMGAFSQ